MIRFVQFSDVHLDASLAESKLAMPEEKRQKRKREIKHLIEQACRLAQNEDCHTILIPGDLFDDESADFDTIHFLIDTFRSAAPLPIFITPGNHDPYLPQSPYNSEFLAEKGIPPWPDNVHIFSAGAFKSMPLPGKEDATVTGIADTGRGIDRERVLSKKIPSPRAAFNILMFHGSREPFPPAKEPTMPFSDEELFSQEFDYVAVGHYHTYAAITDKDGRIRGAYSGTPAAQRLSEVGEKFILLGEIREDKTVSLQKIPLDNRTLHVVEVNCSELPHSEAVIRKIEEEVTRASQNEGDIIHVRLEGRFPAGMSLKLPPDLLADKYFHVAVDASGVRPGYDLKKYLHEPELMRSVEAQFVKELVNKGQAARGDEEKRVIRAALYYGLDALTQDKICGRYED